MWSHEASIETSASPEHIWRIFTEVERWSDWNAGIESIELHGPFAKGSTFTMKPPGQDALTSTLVEVRPNERFTDETVVGDTRVLVEHSLLPLESRSTRIVYRTRVSGPHAEELGRVVTSDFPDVLAALKDLAERS